MNVSIRDNKKNYQHAYGNDNPFSVENAVDEALEGLTFIHPGLKRLAGHRVIVREQVSFICNSK